MQALDQAPACFWYDPDLTHLTLQGLVFDLLVVALDTLVTSDKMTPG